MADKKQKSDHAPDHPKDHPPDHPPDNPKDHPDVRIIPPLVPLFTIVAGLVLGWLWPVGMPFGFEPGLLLRVGVGGGLIVAAIVGLGLWAVILVRRSGQSEIPWTPTDSVLTHGPYRFTRNPMYLQLIVACVGAAVLFWNLWILLLTPLCAWILHTFAILPEEAYLEEKFGDAYRAYKKRVRRWV